MTIDKTDRKILNYLQGNAQLSVAEIADKVSISKSACWRRIQKLEESNIILQRVTLLNPSKINLSLSIFIVVRTNQHNDQWLQNFTSVLQDIPEVLEIHRLSGDLDYIIKAVVPDMQGFNLLYKKIIKADLADVSSSFVMNTYKQTTQMPLSHI